MYKIIQIFPLSISNEKKMKMYFTEITKQAQKYYGGKLERTFDFEIRV